MQLSKILSQSLCAGLIAASAAPALAEPGHAHGMEHKAEPAKQNANPAPAPNANPNAMKPKPEAAAQAKPAAAAAGPAGKAAPMAAAAPAAEKPMSRLEALAKARKELLASLRQGETALARAARLTLAAKQKLQARAHNPKAQPTEVADLSKDVIVKHDDTVAQVSVLEGASQQLESTEAELAQLVAEAEKQATEAKTNADAAMAHARELAAAAREARRNLVHVRAQAGLGGAGAIKARQDKLARDREAWKAKRAQSDAVVQEAQNIAVPAATTTPAAASPAAAATAKPAK